MCHTEDGSAVQRGQWSQEVPPDVGKGTNGRRAPRGVRAAAGDLRVPLTGFWGCWAGLSPPLAHGPLAAWTALLTPGPTSCRWT